MIDKCFRIDIYSKNIFPKTINFSKTNTVIVVMLLFGMVDIYILHDSFSKNDSLSLHKHKNV